jgi:hypothetical protein
VKLRAFQDFYKEAREKNVIGELQLEPLFRLNKRDSWVNQILLKLNRGKGFVQLQWSLFKPETFQTLAA